MLAQRYPEYVKTQREKDAGAYSVKAALERSQMFERADPGWLSVLKAHYGAIARAEYAAASAESRMARFAKAPGQRNMATLGMLDEIRHGQIQLFFPHEYCPKDRQFDWAFKAYSTNEWAAVAARHMFDDIMNTRSAVGVGLMLTFAFETGFTNMQFLGLAADAVPVESRNPIGKRILYMDAQTSIFPIINMYDRKGALWKRWAIGFSDSAYHAPANQAAGIAIYTSASMLDVQAQHCTTLQLRMISDPALSPPSIFSVQNLRGGD